MSNVSLIFKTIIVVLVTIVSGAYAQDYTTLGYERSTPTNVDSGMTSWYPDDEYYECYGVVLLPFETDHKAETMQLYVCAPLTETKMVVPGVFPINDTEETGTCVASIGCEEGYVYPSCVDTGYTQYGDSCYYSTSYFFDSCTFTMIELEEGIQAEFNATRHFGLTIHVVYSDVADAAGIKDVASAKVSKNSKFLKDGNLVIVRNSCEYNAIGIEK